MRSFNLIFLGIFAGLMVWVFMFDTPQTRAIQQRVSAISAPFKQTGAQVQDAITGASDEKRTPTQLKAENLKLATENAELKIHRDRNKGLQTKVRELEELLKFESKSPYRLIPARIIVRKTGAWYRQATIDRGQKHGIQDGSPIIIPVGPEGQPALVGRIARVLPDESDLFLITDELCKVAGRIEGTNHQGMLEGLRLSTSRRPELRLRYLSKDSRAEKGRRVYTWDRTTRFPTDILLGTVADFRQGDSSNEAIVEPAVNLEDLPYVFVMEQDATPPPAAAPR
jgi:rod shape-determining protein MreC